MKEISMRLKEIPPGYYAGFSESIYCISPDKVYMVRQTNIDKDYSSLKYLFRLPTKYNVYEAMITKQLWDGILLNNSFSNSDYKSQFIYEYLFGKDTIRVISELDLFGDSKIIAIGPEENKEWQYEFQKYHV